MVATDTMNLLDLTPSQLKRAAAIKEQVDGLSKQLRAILGGPTSIKKRSMSASVRKRIAAQKARWAKLRRAKSTTRSAQPAAKPKRKRMSPAARAKLSAKLKAYWASKENNKK